MNDDTAAIVDIVLACRHIGEFVLGVDQPAFIRNTLVHSAVIRQLEVIGEAAKRTSDELRTKLPEIPWKDMAGLRDRLIHAYHDVDLPRVWRIASVDVPLVLAALEPLMPTSE